MQAHAALGRTLAPIVDARSPSPSQATCCPRSTARCTTPCPRPSTPRWCACGPPRTGATAPRPHGSAGPGKARSPRPRRAVCEWRRHGPPQPVTIQNTNKREPWWGQGLPARARARSQAGCDCLTAACGPHNPPQRPPPATCAPLVGLRVRRTMRLKRRLEHRREPEAPARVAREPEQQANSALEPPLLTPCLSPRLWVVRWGEECEEECLFGPTKQPKGPQPPLYVSHSAAKQVCARTVPAPHCAPR